LSDPLKAVKVSEDLRHPEIVINSLKITERKRSSKFLRKPDLKYPPELSPAEIFLCTFPLDPKQNRFLNGFTIWQSTNTR